MAGRFEILEHRSPEENTSPRFQLEESAPTSRFEILEHIPTSGGVEPSIGQSNHPAVNDPNRKFEILKQKEKREARRTDEFNPDTFDWGAFGLKPSLAKAVAAIESNFKPHILSQPDKIDPKTGKERPAEVRAAGLMQMRKGAWIDANKFLGTDYPLEARFDPKINAMLGSAYLRHMINRADGDVRTGLAMYYAGEGGYRSDPKLRREGQVYANKILNKQRDFEREMQERSREEHLAQASPLERAGMAAIEGVGSRIMALPQLAVLGADLVKWGLGEEDAFRFSREFSQAMEMIPDEQKSLSERMLSYGVSSLTMGLPSLVPRVGRMFDDFVNMVSRPFVKKNVAGFTVGATAGAVDHYSRDTVFEGWSPVAAGVGGAFLLRNVGNNNVVRAFEGTMKLPAATISDELTSAVSNTPGQVVGDLTTAQIIGDPDLASLQNRMAMYEDVGGDLKRKLRVQSQALHKKGQAAFPGNENRVLHRFQEEAKHLEDQIASFIGNPSRVEGEIELRKFLDANRNRIIGQRNALYDIAGKHPVTLNVDPIEDVLDRFIHRPYQLTGAEPKAVRLLHDALYERIPKAKGSGFTVRLRKGEQTDFNQLKKAWGELSTAEQFRNDPDAATIAEHLKNLAVDPASNPDGWEYASAASTFHNAMLDIYEPITEAGGKRTKDTLLYREAHDARTDPGQTVLPRTGLSSYDDVMDIRRLSLPVRPVNSPEFITATKEQIDRALNPVLKAQLAEEAFDPLTGKLRPGHAAAYLAKKKDVYDAAGMDTENIFQLDVRARDVETTQKALESKSILEATLDVIGDRRKFNDFVEVSKRYGAEGKRDFNRLAAVSILGEMFPENIALSAGRPGARQAGNFDPSAFLDSYAASRMLNTDQRNLLKALNQARAGIAGAERAGEMSAERLAAAVPGSVLTNIVRAAKNAAIREKSEVAGVMGRRDARLLAAALHDPAIAKRILNTASPTFKSVDMWYERMDGVMNDWQRRFLRDLKKGGIVARKVDETMRRMGMSQYLMEESRVDRGLRPENAKPYWERTKGVFR